ncbi:MAG: YfhO family protein [Clostridiales bacterium]|nr:YfhO family protein [Clostridiales bacterium]
MLEKKFVFHKKILSSTLKQIGFLIFRCAVDFGFYKLSEFVFGNLLDMPIYFVWLIAITISVLFNYFFDRILLFDCAYDASEIKGSRIYKCFYTYRYVFLSMAAAAITITLIYVAFSIFPFGDSTVMRMDLYHQYGPLMAELYDRVVNHQSFLYSWESGGGSSFIGNFFNYLSSPLSALIFLFDKEDISLAITFIVSVKCIISAGTFSFYLVKSQKRTNRLVPVFGVFYAFCAYFLAYYWNIMWLEGMMLLPIIALGIERIIDYGKCKTYIFSLALLLYCSYYMGFMTCIFSVIYFLGYYVISRGNTNVLDKTKTFKNKYSFKAAWNNRFFNRGVKFAASSVISAMLCAFTLIPVFIILRSSSATSDSFPSTFESYFNIFDFFTSHLTALDETIRSSGEDVLPNVYSGILTIVLLPIFIVNKDIRFKDKASYLLMLIVFFTSFNNNCLNFIWHAFHFPNDLPYRFSYMYSFILLIVAYKTLDKIKSISVKDICYSGIILCFFVAVSQKLSTEKMTEFTIYASLAFIILWTAFLYLLRKGTIKKAVAVTTAVSLACVEVLLCNGDSIHSSQGNEAYTENYADYTQLIDFVEENDDSFYRMDLTYLTTKMDPCYYGYNGMSVFSSMAYEEYSQLQYTLGMASNRINSYTYNSQTAVYNAMFNIKYVIQAPDTTEPAENLFSLVTSSDSGDSAIYENMYYLPISYAVSENVENWDPEEGNPFEAQGDFFELATGYSDVFKSVEYLSTQFDNIVGSEVTANGTQWFSKTESGNTYGYADITFTPAKSGNVYIYVSSSDIDTIDVSTDTSYVSQSIDEPYILDLGYYEEGEEITLSLDIGASENDDCYAEIYAYTLDEDVFESGYSYLQKGQLNVTDYSDTEINGTVTVDENSYLYSSIPYDESWHVYIDGEECETFEIGGAMLGVLVKAGTHEITYKYVPRGLSYGIVISAATLIGLCGYAFYNRKKNKKENSVNLLK